MKHLQIFENFGYNQNDAKKLYAILSPEQIKYFRKIFSTMQARTVEYALNVLNTIEENGGKCTNRQWDVLIKTKDGGNYPVRN